MQDISEPPAVGVSRRDALLGSLTAGIAAGLPAVAAAKTPMQPLPATINHGKQAMSTITTKDGTEIYYKDWGTGPVVTFSHGWPLNSDAWDGQMLFLAQHGFRVVAHDRRGHGRSSQPTSENDMNGYADDLAAVIEALDLRDATLVGHSTGGGEVARYIGRHGTKRVAKAVLIAAVPPVMVKSATNPEGLPIEAFDAIRAGLVKDRSQFYRDLALQFYGANRPGSNVSQGTLDQFWLWSMQAGLLNAYECVKAFSETDFTEDLKKFDVPTLVLHGEDDQIVPVKDSAVKSARLIKGAKDIYYPRRTALPPRIRTRSTPTCSPSSRPDPGGMRSRPPCFASCPCLARQVAPFPFPPFPSSPFCRRSNMPKTWLITGSASGIGRSTAELVLARGDNLVATARNVNRLLDLARRYGKQVALIELDVTDMSASRGAVATAMERSDTSTCC
ncbi:alpha/beta hydrolase family protein (plasmid) [Rhizobium etli 8C-3]|uniref:Alpha/beta hydrolase family protein n=1 Tax=Rhizobium etli 8C-3 TaxID=538025 RepID=A0A1L5PCG1_RHIET|nr:alpha/beta hydrolase family protein [Rhizobium etli 8C-3]